MWAQHQSVWYLTKQDELDQYSELADMERKLSRFPLISPPRAVLAGALVLLAFALPAAAFFGPARPVPSDTGSDQGAGAMEYLSEFGFGVEYGSATPVIHKWTQDVKIEVHGSPTEADL